MSKNSGSKQLKPSRRQIRESLDQRELEPSRIPFMRFRKVAGGVSLLLVLLSIGLLVSKSLNFGLDFTGGTLVELESSQAVNLAEVRSALGKEGFIDAVVQHFGNEREILVRVSGSSPDLGAKVSNALASGNFTVKRVEFVGPKVGDELSQQGTLGLLMALAVVMVYVALRFQLKFSVGAVVALVHDVIIVLGVFALTQATFDLTVLAALLAVIGYSLNDTIVVSDRVRENFRAIRGASPSEVIDHSLNQTLGRTLVTSLTTLLVLVALYLFGGEAMRGFALALIIGVVIGTWSSIYVAANILMLMQVKSEDLIQRIRAADEDIDYSKYLDD